jgi:tetratricopeptide (TPR) repeat protein
LITHLGSLHPKRLGVIGRSSVMRYKTGQRPQANAGRELAVAYVVEGSVRANADRLRITTRLVKVADQAVVWTDVFESASSDLFQTQPDAAARITGAVTTHLFPRHKAPATRVHVAGSGAYEAFTKGRYLQHKGSRAELERSLAFFENATKLDSRYAEAFAAQADAFISMGRTGSPSAEMFPRAASAARAAISADPNSAEAHNALANVLFWFDWKWAEAEQHFKRAIELNPSLAAAHHDYAWLLVARGRTEEGLISLRSALALDPLSYRVNIDAGWLLLHAHRFDQAVQQARRALELEPGFNEAKACIARSLLFQKDYRGALEHLSAVNPALGSATSADPEAVIRRAFRNAAGSPFTAATQYAFNNENSKALDALEQALKDHSTMLPLLKTEPSFINLHGEPRFQELMRRVGL